MTPEEEYKQACDEVILVRGKDKTNSVCVSGEEVGGVYKKYTSEYMKWNLKAMWVKVAVSLSDEERTQWFEDNPPPEDKFEGE